MKIKLLVFILVFLAAMHLQSCIPIPFIKPPTPTSTYTLAPTLTVDEQADEIAFSLSGDKAIDCGSMRYIEYFESILIVDQCLSEALQTKQPFRALRGQYVNLIWENTWIVGTPTGEIYLVSYDFAADVGLESSPKKRLCSNPHISTKESWETGKVIEFFDCY